VRLFIRLLRTIGTKDAARRHMQQRFASHVLVCFSSFELCHQQCPADLAALWHVSTASAAILQSYAFGTLQATSLIPDGLTSK